VPPAPTFWKLLLTSPLDPLKRDRWARLRFAIIGPLLAAPPAAGELSPALLALSTKSWRHPVSGLDVCFGASTIERWYYAARAAADPVAILRNRLRGNLGRFKSLSPAAIQILTAQYHEHPGWTVQLHFDNLRVALAGTDSSLPSYPTIRRYLQAQGMFRQASCPTGDRRGAAGPGSARPAGGQELRSRLRLRTLASRLPSRLPQGPHPRRPVGQAAAVWRHRRSLAAGLPSAVVSRRDRRESRAWPVAGLHETRLATCPDDRQRRRHARRRNRQRPRPSGGRASDDLAVFALSSSASPKPVGGALRESPLSSRRRGSIPVKESRKALAGTTYSASLSPPVVIGPRIFATTPS
jgi:hypothetical protein